MIFLDTETCGLTGPMLLIQWAENDGPVHLHEVFYSPISETMRLIEKLVDHPGGICGFNLSFDWFHLQRAYCVLALHYDKSLPPTSYSWQDHLREAVWGPCLRPQSAMDLMLHARQGPMQSLMERDDVRIRRVPRQLAKPLAEELTRRVVLDDIYFSRRKDGSAWQVEEEPDDEAFPDLVLRFGASGGLKPLARHLLGVEALDYPMLPSMQTSEDSWNPFTEHASHIVQVQAGFWKSSTIARQYAQDDVEHTRNLWRYWGSPPAGDLNSELAICVACSRHRGYGIDPTLIAQLHDQALTSMYQAPRSPGAVLSGLHERMSETERLVVDNTRGETLEAVAKWGSEHAAARFAGAVIKARTAEKEKDLLYKLFTVKRFHPDFKVIGALSGRMSGSSGLNPQGINRDGEIRQALFIEDDNQGGDFDGFEVTIADAVYQDPQLHNDLKSGKKLHALFGSAMYNEDYNVIKASPVSRLEPARGWEGDLYNPAKHGVFAWIYGAQAPKIAQTMRLSVEETEKGIEEFFSRYPQLKEGRTKDEMAFCSMRQPGGVGSRVIWHEPADKVESLFGFARYFTLENSICKALYDLAEDLPEHLANLKMKVTRRDRVQTVSGATRSALFGAAFQIQARNMRAAGNHRIQSTGAHITKVLQKAIWDQQPPGIHPYVVRPMNVHDEILCPSSVELGSIVQSTIESFKGTVPLLKMDWKKNFSSWGTLKS